MIRIRKATTEDSYLYLDWINNKDNLKYMSSYTRTKYYTNKDVIEEILDDDYGTVENLIIEYNNLPIGIAGLEDIDKIDKRTEIYYLIGDLNYQGRGLGKEILLELIGYVFEEKKLNNIIASVMSINAPSIHMLEKFGFRFIGVIKEYNYVDGNYVDEFLYQYTLKDWLQRRD